MIGRCLIWGRAGAVFLVTVGISSWRNGLWEPDPVTETNTTASQSVNQTRVPEQPFAAEATPAAEPPPLSVAAPSASPAFKDPQDAATSPPPVTAESVMEGTSGTDNVDVRPE
jgi:hypothetical protein